MYTNQKLSQILSLLDNLSKPDLVRLKNIIDSLISNNTNFSSQLIKTSSIHYIDSRISSNTNDTNFITIEQLKKYLQYQYGSQQSRFIENVNDISKPITNLPDNPKIIDANIRNNPMSKVIPDLTESGKIKNRRPSGIWKGKVSMPDNFNDLSSDILSDFGMDK